MVIPAGSTVNLFERRPKLCNNCEHWYRAALVNTKDGYVEALCQQKGPDPRDQPMRRGSDSCSHWQRGVAL